MPASAEAQDWQQHHSSPDQAQIEATLDAHITARLLFFSSYKCAPFSAVGSHSFIERFGSSHLQCKRIRKRDFMLPGRLQSSRERERERERWLSFIALLPVLLFLASPNPSPSPAAAAEATSSPFLLFFPLPPLLILSVPPPISSKVLSPKVTFSLSFFP